MTTRTTLHVADIPTADAGRVDHVRRAASRGTRPEVLALLEAELASLDPSDARSRNLDALAQGAAAVVTGQQAGLFLGPLYTLYKVLTAVKLAAALEEESGVRCVPVFWLQLEDHDYDEVRATALQTREATLLRLELPPDPGEAQGSAGRISLAYRKVSPDVEQLLITVEEAAGFYPHADEVVRLLRAHYRPGAPWGEAFKGLLAALTERYGMLFFNPRAESAAPLLQPAFQKAYEERNALSALLLSQADRLAKQRVDAPVMVRSDSPLFFYHPEGKEGPRYRLAESEGRFHTIGAEHALDASSLEDLLRSSPERFSTSALLRPLAQDLLLPTAAYVGGEAERRYHRQIEPLYERFSLPVQLVAPRAHLTCVDEKTARWLEFLHLSPHELQAPRAEIERMILERRGSTFPATEQLAEEFDRGIDRAFAPLQAVFTALDPTLERSLTKNREKLRPMAEALFQRYSKALLTHDALAHERLQKAETLLYPGGVPQERVYCAVAFLCRYGEDFIDRLMERIELFSAESKELLL